MTFWKWWANSVKKSSHGQDLEDITYPEDKGKLSIEHIKSALKDVDDVKFQSVSIDNHSISIVYVSSLIDNSVLQRLVYEPLNNLNDENPKEKIKSAELVNQNQLQKTIHDILSGYTLLYFSKQDIYLKVNTFSAPQRSVNSPENEATVLGPQDSFTESLQTNLSLIKRRIINPHLKTKTMMIGTETQSKVSVLYMGNIANQENVKRVLYRIKNIEFHGFMGLAMLKQMLEDKPYSPFPQFLITSRPDFVTEHLLDGRIIIILDGSPEAAVAPAGFFEMFISPEDMYNRWTTASMLRLLRFWGFFVTIMFTSTYVSVLTYHPSMLPPAMLAMLAESRAKVPFPPLIEVLIMETVIEILREAGARMPTKIGQTLGIVGGIVIGTAAVEAGLASNVLIVLIAVSALLSFIPTNYLMSNAARITRYIFILGAGAFGMFGQALALAWLMAHLSNMTSLGTPYMSPIPRKMHDLEQTIIRAPMNFLLSRKSISRAKKELIRPTDEE